MSDLNPEQSQRLDERTVLVTGASRGIGQATARWLSELGGIVYGTATSESGAQSIERWLGEGRGLVLDVTSAEDVQRVVKRVGIIDVLVNNAAINRDQILLRLKDEDWEQVLNTNLTGVMRMTRACLRPMLKARFGRVITISSVVGFSGNPGQTNYCAAKAGLSGFSRALAQEVGSRGITVNLVAPGFIDTDMTRALDEAQRDRLRGTIPLGRLGQAEDVAACVAFLAGAGGAYITGQTLHVNGGMYMI